MTGMQRDPEILAAEASGATPPEAPPAARACPTCHADLADGQDWCLSCGQAQPSRLASLPGKRAAATVVALTTVLVGGAVAASYAALQDGSAAPGSNTPTQLAQATTAQPAAPVAPPATQPSAALPAAPTAATPAGPTATLPDTTVPSTPTPTPAPKTPSSSGTSSSGSSGSSTSSGDKGTSKDSTADTRTSASPADTPLERIKLEDAAAAVYDPYSRNTATGDTTKTLDADPGTSFPITVAPGSGSIAAGVVVDLGKQRGVREIDLTTKTPGFKVELYATDSEELPPDVLDTRWAHLKDVSDIGAGAGNKQIISLGSGTTKYRHVLLWFTAPPTDGLTVRVSELKLLG
jgi:hypothetical protein